MSEPEMIYDAMPDEIDEPQDEQPQPLALAVYTGPSDAEVAALKGMLKAANRDMSDAQFTVFLAAAKHLGLDPLARQIVPIFQGGRMTVQTTIDGFRLIAERTRKYRGQLGPFWCGPDGEWREVWLADGAPAAAKVGVLRSDFSEPMWGVARYKSYAKGGNWSQMPDVMIAKVAESLALRKAFPAELSGAYTAEELSVVDADPMSAAQPVTKPTTARATATPAATERPQQPKQATRPSHQPAPSHSDAGRPTAAPADEGKAEPPATDKQAIAIKRLCEELERSVPLYPNTYTEASRLIQQLSAEKAARNPDALREAFPAGQRGA